MEIDKLSEVKDETLDPEMEKFFRSAFIRTNGFILKQISQRMKEECMTLEDLRQEIITKKSPLSKMQRDFILSYKLDFINDCLEDMKNKTNHNGNRN